MIYLLTGSRSRARYVPLLSTQATVVDVVTPAEDPETLAALITELAADRSGHFFGLTDFGELMAYAIRWQAGWVADDELDAFLTVLDKQRLRDRINELVPGAAIDCRPVGQVPADGWPRFVKPRRSQLSTGSGVIDSPDSPLVAQLAAEAGFESGYATLGEVTDRGPIADFCRSAADLLAEEVIPPGDQITVEVVEGQPCGSLSVFEPNGQSFAEFRFPYTAPSYSVRREIADTVATVAKLIPRTPVFNLEFLVTDEHAYLVEANPRMASQFSQVNKRVFGVDTISAVTFGRVRLPDVRPWSTGLIRVLRTDTDQVFEPSISEAELSERLPGDTYVHFLAETGRPLSAIQQDGYSLRFAEISGPFDESAQSREQLAECEELVRTHTGVTGRLSAPEPIS